jgi:TonB family protein
LDSKEKTLAQQALYNEIAGTVVVQFVVDSNGNITNPIVLKDIGHGSGSAALRVVNKMPKWIPGEQAGQKVSVRYTLPIRFRMVKLHLKIAYPPASLLLIKKIERFGEMIFSFLLMNVSNS